MIAENKISVRPRIIRYHYPEALNKPPVRWCEKFENIQVEYERGIPPQAEYWTSIENNTLCILDDLWHEASNCVEVANAFKIYARKQKYSLVVVTQSFFENGRYGKIIRYLN